MSPSGVDTCPEETEDSVLCRLAASLAHPPQGSGRPHCSPHVANSVGEGGRSGDGGSGEDEGDDDVENHVTNSFITV